MGKLIKTTLYYYCLSDRFKKQIGSYSCETIGEDEENIFYKDANDCQFSIKKTDLNLTIFKGAIDADYAIVFENVSVALDMEEVEKIVCEDSADFLQALADFSKKR